jgi:hypothetical protein
MSWRLLARGRHDVARRFLVVEASELDGAGFYLAGDGSGRVASFGRVSQADKAVTSGGAAEAMAASGVRGCARSSLAAWVARWWCGRGVVVALVSIR